MKIKLRRGTIETVNPETRTLHKWFVFKFTYPKEMAGAYGCVDGAWRWATAGDRDIAMERMKAAATKKEETA